MKISKHFDFDQLFDIGNNLYKVNDSRPIYRSSFFTIDDVTESIKDEFCKDSCLYSESCEDAIKSNSCVMNNIINNLKSNR